MNTILPSFGNLNYKVAEGNIAFTEQLFRKLSQHVPGAIYQFQLFDDGRFCFPYISIGSIEVFEMEPDEVLADPSLVFSKIYKEDAIGFNAARLISKENLSLLQYDFRISLPIKGERWISISSSPERLEDSVLWHGYAQDITEQKEREGLLVESEKKYRSIIESSINGFILGQGGNILDTNEAAVAIFGYENVEEFMKIKRKQLFDEDDPNFIELIKYRTIHGKAKGEITGFKKSGERFPCEFYSVISPNPDGVRKTMNFVVDITERKKTEENLAKSQHLLSNAEAIAKIGSSEVDYKTGKFFWSDEFYRIHGLEPNSFEPTPTLSETFLHPDDRYKIKLFEESAFAHKDHLEFDSKIIRADGEVRDISSYWKYTYDNEGNPLKMYGVVQDITEKKMLEAALKQSEEQFRGAFEYSAMGLALVDLNKNWIQINDSLCNMLGYTKAELLKISFADITHPDDLEIDLEHVKDLIDGKIESFKLEKRYYHKNGDIIWVLLVVSKVRDKNGIVNHLVAQIENITQRRESEKALENLNKELVERADELAESNRELERFAYVASHDLQEPLRMIGSFLQLLQKKYANDLDSKAHEYINYAVDGAKRMKDLILDMLEYSRVNTNPIDFENIDLNEVYGDVKLNLSESISSNKAKIEVSKLPTIKGIKLHMLQLIQNIIGNALKYRSLERDPIINILANEKDTEWEIMISDNGIGIDPRFYEKIFIIFQRLHNKNEYSGTGIGLAICKKIIDKHGGRIWVTSEPGKGSVFYFTLPKSAPTE